MNTIHKGRVIAHFGGQRPKQMTYALLVLYVNIKVADHYYTTIRPDTLLATAKLAGLHVSFHDVDAILLIE